MTDPEATLPPKARSIIGRLTSWAEAHPMAVLLMFTHAGAFVLGAWVS